MACWDNETATAYLRGDLDPQEAAQWAAHLADCAACRETVQRVSALIDSVRQDLMLAFTEPAGVDLQRAEELIIPRASRWLSSAEARRASADGHRWSGTTRKVTFAAAAALVVSLLLPSGTLAWVAENLKMTIQRVIESARDSERTRGGKALPAKTANDVVLSPMTPEARPITGSPPPAPRIPVLGPSDLALLEMQVLARLDSIGALLSGQVDVIRTASRIEVRGLVEDSARRRAIAEALASMPRTGVTISVRAVSEQLREMPAPAGPIQYRPMEFDTGGLPAAAELRAHLTRAGSTGDIDAEIRRIATSSLRYSRVALRHALAMESLAERYEAQALRSLNPKAYEMWVRLIATHASGFTNETRQLRELLEPMFIGESSTTEEAAGGVESADRNDLNGVVMQLTRLAVTIDDVVRQGMTASTRRVQRVQVREAEFWQTVRQAERLAHRLEK